MRHFGFVMAAASLGVAAGAPFCVAAPLGLQLGAAILWTILCTGHRCRVHRPNPPDAPISSKQVSPQLMLRVPCPCPVEETFASHSTEHSLCEPVVPCEASSEEG